MGNSLALIGLRVKRVRLFRNGWWIATSLLCSQRESLIVVGLPPIPRFTIEAASSRAWGNAGNFIVKSGRWRQQDKFWAFARRSTPTCSCWTFWRTAEPFPLILRFFRWFRMPCSKLQKFWFCILRWACLRCLSVYRILRIVEWRGVSPRCRLRRCRC